MDPAVSKSVTVTPAYAYPHDAASDVKVGYTAPLPTVPAMSRTQDTMNKMGIDVTKMEVAEDVKSYKPSITSDMYIKEFKDTTSFSAMKALREKVNAELVFVLGQRHESLYDAGVTALLVGVEAKSMTVLLNEHGGIFDFSYEIDVEHSGCGVNSYHVEIREA